MEPQRTQALAALGKKNRHLRQKVGVSQEELAARSGLDRTYISGVERGVRNPSFTALVKIADGLSLSVSTLLEGLENQVSEGRPHD